MTGLLASVANLQEARLALAGDADIIDLKNPAAGALGALSSDAVQHIVQTLAGQKPLSATIGDLPMQPEILLHAANAMVDTGVDYLKIGFFPDGDWSACLTALSRLAQRNRLIAVLFADDPPASGWIAAVAEAGFSGIMLDTRDKAQGNLRQHLNDNALAQFVSQAHQHDLLCGLAGALRLEDIAPLLSLAPDYLGFRGALCLNQQRTAGLNVDALAQVRCLMP